MAGSAAAHRMSHPTAGRLALDEMFSPAIAAALRELGHDVVAVAERVDLRSMTDDDLFAWSAAERRWLLTENVKDFRPIMLRALQAGPPACGLLFTSTGVEWAVGRSEPPGEQLGFPEQELGQRLTLDGTFLLGDGPQFARIP